MTLMATTVRVPVGDSSQVGEARRAAIRFGADVGIAESDAGGLAILATEMAANLARHGGGGDLLLRRVEGASPSLELLALDRGPGMADIALAFEDGHSTGGTPGTGLGAIRRLSATCELYSAPGVGTVLMARYPAGPRGRAAAMEIGAVSLPYPGEQESGDGWAVWSRPDRVTAMVVDGLGHGPAAALAAREALRVFDDVAGRSPREALEAVHGALRATRGAAVAIAAIDTGRRSVTFAGVGNIAGAILANGSTRSAVSTGGIVGHEFRRPHEFEYPWPEGAALVMHSDGLQSQWKLDPYPGLAQAHPALIAGVLIRDYSRPRDDVTVLVLREPR